MDLGKGGMCWAKNMHIRTIINVMEPLKCGVFITVAGVTNGLSLRRSNKWIEFSYEKQLEFCFKCDCLGHVNTDCYWSVIGSSDQY